MSGACCTVCLDGNTVPQGDIFCCDLTCSALAMNTVQPNPSISQVVGCCGRGDGGAGNAQSWLNSLGRVGTSLAGVFTGRAVVSNSRGVAVGARGSRCVPRRTSSGTLLIILIVAAILFYIATRN